MRNIDGSARVRNHPVEPPKQPERVRRLPPPVVLVVLAVLLSGSIRAETLADFAKVKVWTATFRCDLRETGSLVGPLRLSVRRDRREEVSGRVLLRLTDVTEDGALWEGEDGRGQGSGRIEEHGSSIVGSGGHRSVYQGTSRCTGRLSVSVLDERMYVFEGNCGEDEVPASWVDWGPDARPGGTRTEHLLGASSETQALPPRGLTLEGPRTERTVEGSPGSATSGSSERVVVHSWRIVPGEIEELELVFEPVDDFYPRWLPEGNLEVPARSGNALDFRARVQKVGGGVPTRRVAGIEFTLDETSHEQGICLNFPPLGVADENPDLALISVQGNGPVPDWAQTFTVSNVPEAVITVRSFDYGAWGVLRVKARMEDGEELVGRFLPTSGTGAIIPADRDGNHVADAWEAAKEVSGPPETDEDGPANQAAPGDGIPLYEEYRGFAVLDAAGVRKHQRTEPGLKTLFVIDPHEYWRAADWRTATEMESYRLEPDLAGEGNPEMPAKGNASNSNRGFGRLAEWDYAVRILREPENVDGCYGRVFPPDDWTDERLLSDQEPKQIRYVGMWPSRVDRAARFMRENLEIALSGAAPPGSPGRQEVILGIRAFLNTPERQAMARQAVERLADPASVAALAAALLRRIVVHEVGHACGVDHHGNSVVDGAAVTPQLEAEGPESCPMRYNLDKASDLVVIPIVEMLAPGGGMAAGGGRFCPDYMGCWASLDVKDD